MRKNHQTGNLKSFLSDVRPEAGGASFQTKRTQNISMLSPARIYYVLRIILGYGLPERETCCMLSFCRAFEFLPLYKRTFRFTPAILEDYTVPRIRSGSLLTCEAQQGFTPTRKWRRHFRRQQTTFAALRLIMDIFIN